MLHLTSELTTVKDQKRNVNHPSPLLSLGIELRNKTNIHEIIRESLYVLIPLTWLLKDANIYTE